MPNSHITNFVNAVVNKVSTLINSHNSSNDAHSSLFSSKADTGHSHSYADLSNTPTIPAASSLTPLSDTTNGSHGSGISYARANHRHPKSSLYAEASHSHDSIYYTKSEVDSILGTLRDYINQ